LLNQAIRQTESKQSTNCSDDLQDEQCVKDIHVPLFSYPVISVVKSDWLKQQKRQQQLQMTTQLTKLVKSQRKTHEWLFKVKRSIVKVMM